MQLSLDSNLTAGWKTVLTQHGTWLHFRDHHCEWTFGRSLTCVLVYASLSQKQHGTSSVSRAMRIYGHPWSASREDSSFASGSGIGLGQVFTSLWEAPASALMSQPRSSCSVAQGGQENFCEPASVQRSFLCISLHVCTEFPACYCPDIYLSIYWSIYLSIYTHLSLSIHLSFYRSSYCTASADSALINSIILILHQIPCCWCENEAASPCLWVGSGL